MDIGRFEVVSSKERNSLETSRCQLTFTPMAAIRKLKNTSNYCTEKEVPAPNENLPEGENGEWAIRLVARRMGHGASPEVVFEEGNERVAPHHVRIPDYGHQVVMHKLPVQGVEVAAGREQGHE
ncbi:hypothetical protein AVEN_81715-1 [Araneus ventricosus]|uniref:Uncharacterized protein n=1 Tax=Araneus ventricosus TaxID=182803 RepID=A0A4Y2IC32_ARAVE|nr:hypothetical protein AVEN_81715-1 [Araneus ventricosus]